MQLVTPEYDFLLIDSVGVHIGRIFLHSLGQNLAFLHMQMLLIGDPLPVKLFQVSFLSYVYPMYFLGEGKELKGQLSHPWVLRYVIGLQVRLDHVHRPLNLLDSRLTNYFAERSVIHGNGLVYLGTGHDCGTPLCVYVGVHRLGRNLLIALLFSYGVAPVADLDPNARLVASLWFLAAQTGGGAGVLRTNRLSMAWRSRIRAREHALRLPLAIKKIGINELMDQFVVVLVAFFVLVQIRVLLIKLFGEFVDLLVELERARVHSALSVLFFFSFQGIYLHKFYLLGVRRLARLSRLAPGSHQRGVASSARVRRLLPSVSFLGWLLWILRPQGLRYHQIVCDKV